MKGIILGLYNDFQCMAGKCTSTCCAGWEIVVDNEAFKHFENIEDADLKRDILSHICETDRVKHFVNKSDGKCSMLDSDGLCRIQKNIGEEMLCNTCRKFPRLISKHNGLLWISMAASCPVVADYIVNNKVKWYMIGNKGNISPIDARDIPFISNEMNKYRELLEDHILNSKTGQDYINIYKLFINLADSILDIVVESKEVCYLEGSFEYFEDEKSALQIISQFDNFNSIVKEKYSSVLVNYLEYRIFTRYLKMPQEDKLCRISQVFGEMAFIYFIALSRYYTLAEEDKKIGWERIINWVYRLCVHSLKPSSKLHKLFLNTHWLL